MGINTKENSCIPKKYPLIPLNLPITKTKRVTASNNK